MRRKVSLWIVILLVAALAATTAATVVLATDDRDGRVAADEALPTGPHGQWQMPFGGEHEPGWYGDRHDEVLPWILFAVATGAAVGMLIAWSPWRTSPATTGGGAQAASAVGAGREATRVEATEPTAGAGAQGAEPGAERAEQQAEPTEAQAAGQATGADLEEPAGGPADGAPPTAG